jgi:hypothetical protein
MVSVLMVANGTSLLRHSITALRATGYRVTLYNATNARDLRRSAPDILVFAAEVPRVAQNLLKAVRDDAALRDLPVVIVGRSSEVFAPLPITLLTSTHLLYAPSDGTEVRDAVQAFCPAPYPQSFDCRHAVA